MKITVNKDNVKIEEFDVVHEGEHRVNKCSFSFSEEYTEELVKKAIFTSQNSSVEVAIINNECNIPTEILKARNIVLLGVYAYKVTEDKLDFRYSPGPDAFKVNSGSYIGGANESEEITPSQFEQYMQALNDGLNKVEQSLNKMDSATSSATQLVDKIEQKLENGEFIGPEGSQGIQGVPGTNGKDGVGITTITSGQSTVEEDKTITPITVNKTDGSSQVFNVEAKNGLDGQNGQDGKDGVNGQDGLTPTIGDNGNWFLGDTDTGKPSRGEVGPSPDLSDYVKNTDYASYSKGGVIKTDAYSVETDSNGFLRGKILTKEQFVATGNSDIISKGTMENIKDDYVESSNPVITLNNTLDNLVRKNRVSDYIISLKDALKYKVFEFLVHGKTKQETMTGKNLFDYNNVVSSSHGLNVSLNENGSITVVGNPDTNYIDIVPPTNYDRILEDGETYTVSQDVPGYIYLQIGIVPKDGSATVYVTSSNSSSAKEFSFTVDKTKYTYTAEIQSGTMASLGNNVNFTAKFQLEKGSKATEFEKYTGRQPSPNTDYPQEITTLSFNKITRCGKNIFDYNKFLGDIGDSLIIEGTNNHFTYTCNNSIASTLGIFKFNFKEKKSYSFSGKISSGSANGAMKVIYTDETSFYIYSKWDGTSLSEEFFKTTDKTKTIKQIEISSYGNGTVFELTDFMISEGSTATEYEPYQGQTYDIDLQGNEMVELPNGVKDELVIDKYGNVSLIKNVGKVVFDGSEDEYWTNTYGTNLFDLQDYFNSQNQFIPQAIALSNYYIYNSVQSSMNNNLENGEFTLQKAEIPMGTVYNIFFKNNSCSTVDEWKAWLQEHNTIIYYPLATPKVIPLGKLTELITTEEGINNFFINGNLETTLEVLYARDSEKYLQQYIDDKLATLSQAIIEE